MTTIGSQPPSDAAGRARARAPGGAGDVVVAATGALGVPLVALGLLSLPQLGLVASLPLLAVLGVAVAVLAAWRRRGWVGWQPVLVGAAVGGVASLGLLAWFVVAFSRSMEAMG